MSSRLRKFQPSTKRRPLPPAIVPTAELINDLLNRGVAVHILNMGLIDNTLTGRLIINILLAFAEYERDIIIERTQAGKEIARSKDGFRLLSKKKLRTRRLIRAIINDISCTIDNHLLVLVEHQPLSMKGKMRLYDAFDGIFSITVRLSIKSRKLLG